MMNTKYENLMFLELRMTKELLEDSETSDSAASCDDLAMMERLFEVRDQKSEGSHGVVCFYL